MVPPRRGGGREEIGRRGIVVGKHFLLLRAAQGGRSPLRRGGKGGEGKGGRGGVGDRRRTRRARPRARLRRRVHVVGEIVLHLHPRPPAPPRAPGEEHEERHDAHVEEEEQLGDAREGERARGRARAPRLDRPRAGRRGKEGGGGAAKEMGTRRGTRRSRAPPAGRLASLEALLLLTRRPLEPRGVSGVRPWRGRSRRGGNGRTDRAR